MVIRFDEDALAPGGRQGITGSSFLYAIYDPSSGSCTMARAGHLLPALATPDGHVTFAEVPPGPPLGLGGLPFETAELHLPVGSRLVFFTDGVLQGHHPDIDIGLEHLPRALTGPGHTAETYEAVLGALLPQQSSRRNRPLLYDRPISGAVDPSARTIAAVG